ncbi:MAG: SDR family oxidoreductase [Chloroflexota bacterium]|nr:SDR family oxidoreductase [Chloroflexota bacterium]
MVGKDIFSLDGKVALVVGGTGGIGSAIALGFAQFGADVAVAGRSQDRGEKVAARIQALGRRGLFASVEVQEKESVEAMVEKVIAGLGRIDILVNCAGINRRVNAEEASVEDWDAVVNINLKGTFLVSQAVGRHMIARSGGGKIVNISSLRGELGMPMGYTAYCASKAGVNMFTKQLANEWGRFGIKVNAIAPGWTRTDIVRPLLERPGFIEGLQKRTPLGRMAEPDDLVGASIFLASPASDFITGHILTADGGLSGVQ